MYKPIANKNRMMRSKDDKADMLVQLYLSFFL